jgi:hypothetical protein
MVRHVPCPAHSACAAAARLAKTAVWFAPDDADAVDEVEELDEVLEKMLEVAALLLVKLESAALLDVVVEVDEPVPDRKYPPIPATTKAMTITTAAMVVEIPVLEGRTAQDLPGRGPILVKSRSKILNSWAGISPHLNP